MQITLYIYCFPQSGFSVGPYCVRALISLAVYIIQTDRQTDRHIMFTLSGSRVGPYYMHARTHACMHACEQMRARFVRVRICRPYVLRASSATSLPAVLSTLTSHIHTQSKAIYTYTVQAEAA